MRARHRRAAIVLVSSSLLLAACGSDDSKSSDAAPRSTTSTTAPAVLGDELVGRWAHYDIVAYQDSMMKTMIVSYGFTNFTVEDGKLIEASSSARPTRSATRRSRPPSPTPAPRPSSR